MPGFLCWKTTKNGAMRMGTVIKVTVPILHIFFRALFENRISWERHIRRETAHHENPKMGYETMAIHVCPGRDDGVHASMGDAVQQNVAYAPSRVRQGWPTQPAVVGCVGAVRRKRSAFFREPLAASPPRHHRCLGHPFAKMGTGTPMGMPVPIFYPFLQFQQRLCR